jgi:ADP-ribosylglycohydrolase
MPLAALFGAITLAFAAIAVWSASAHQWPIALAAAALTAWMASLAWTAVRKSRP